MAKKNEFKPDKPYSGFLQKLLLTQKQRRSVLRWALYSLTLVILSVLQDVLLSRVRLFGATTELVPCGIFLICVLEGAERSCIFALVASFLYLFSGTAAGVYSVVFLTVLAVVISILRQSYLQSGFPAAMLCTAVALVLYKLLECFFGVFLELTPLSNIGSFLLTAALTVPAAAVLYPIFLTIGGGSVWRE